MKLGIIYLNDNVINHRSLTKVLLNPILRYFGYQIVSNFLINDYQNTTIRKCDKVTPIKWCFKYDAEYTNIVKKHLIW